MIVKRLAGLAALFLASACATVPPVPIETRAATWWTDVEALSNDGMEGRAARDSGQVLIARRGGLVTSVTAERIDLSCMNGCPRSGASRARVLAGDGLRVRRTYGWSGLVADAIRRAKPCPARSI